MTISHRAGTARGVAAGVLLAAALILHPRAVSAQQADLSFLLTRAEESGYTETTRYDEAVGFLEVLAAQDPLMHLTWFGYSVEGRPLPLVVYGRVASTDPARIRSDRRVRVFVQANIHAGEVSGKEAVLALLRDLVISGPPAWTDSVLLMVAPIYNADGNERVSLYNRPRQNGPVGGMGERPNARGLDLNRDHMKLASPEARSLVRLMSAYDPHVLVDLHTTNGSRHGYHLTYAPPLHPATSPIVTGLLRGRLLPQITDSVRARSGWEMYYYGNLPWPGQEAERGWYTFDHRPRFNNNYIGLRNRMALLGEAYAYASFRERVWVSRMFVEEIIDWAAAHAAEIRDTASRAEREVVTGTPVPLRAAFARSDEPVDILMGSAETERHPFTGAPMLVMTGERRVESMYEYGTFSATERTVAPGRYLVPGSLDRIRALLDDHGIRYDVLQEDGVRQVEQFVIDSTRVADRPFQGTSEREVFGGWSPAAVTVSAGWLSVPVDQPLGRLLVLLLEPRSDDGIVNWGLLDPGIAEARLYPIVREPAD